MEFNDFLKHGNVSHPRDRTGLLGLDTTGRSQAVLAAGAGLGGKIPG